MVPSTKDSIVKSTIFCEAYFRRENLKLSEVWLLNLQHSFTQKTSLILNLNSL